MRARFNNFPDACLLNWIATFVPILKASEEVICLMLLSIEFVKPKFYKISYDLTF